MHAETPQGPPPTPATPPPAPGVSVQPVYQQVETPRDPTIAVLLEVIPGFFQVFGIGHIYAGRVGMGLFFMFGYWLLSLFNGLLTMVLIGFITWPLTWLATMIFSPILAARSCRTPVR